MGKLLYETDQEGLTTTGSGKTTLFNALIELLPCEVACRGVVDGIAMVIHMTRRQGKRFVEEALEVQDYNAAASRWAHRADMEGTR